MGENVANVWNGTIDLKTESSSSSLARRPMPDSFYSFYAFHVHLLFAQVATGCTCFTATFTISRITTARRCCGHICVRAVAILRGGLGGPWQPQIFAWPPVWIPQFFLKFPLSSFSWHVQGCRMHFVKIPAILSTAPDLSCVVIRKRHRENRDNLYC